MKRLVRLAVTLDDFEELWCVDFEFRAPAGERPDPVCLVARELRTGRVVRQWRGEFSTLPPYRTDAQALFIAYYASAELGCHLALDWPMPVNVLDLYAEFRNATNGLRTPAGRGLLGALAYFGLDHIATTQKDASRDLIMRGGPWDAAEREAILDYCESDVTALDRLLARMAPAIDLPRALVRGRYMAAAARMEWNGVPIDGPMLEVLRGALGRDQGPADRRGRCGLRGLRERHLQARTLRAVPCSRGHRLAPPCERSSSIFPTTPSARSPGAEPRVAPLRELRDSLSQMRLADLSVGSDGRNRALLSAFGSRTGRNQPSNAKFIFGPSVWLRGLIRPEPGFCDRLHRLELAGIRHRRRALRGRANAGGLRLGGPVSRVREAGRRRPARRDEAVAQARARGLQNRAPRRRVRDGGRCARRSSRHPADRGARASAEAPGDLPAGFGAGARTSWTPP